MLTCSYDRTARVWDATTGTPVTPPLPHDREVIDGAWSAEGDRVATVSFGQAARLWDVAPQAGATSDLLRRAELLSAHRLDGHGGLVPLTAAELRERWAAGRKK